MINLLMRYALVCVCMLPLVSTHAKIINGTMQHAQAQVDHTESLANLIATNITNYYNVGENAGTLPTAEQMELDVTNSQYLDSVTNDAAGVVTLTFKDTGQLSPILLDRWIKLWPIDNNNQITSFECTTNIDGGSPDITPTVGDISVIVGVITGRYYGCIYETDLLTASANYVAL